MDIDEIGYMGIGIAIGGFIVIVVVAFGGALR